MKKKEISMNDLLKEENIFFLDCTKKEDVIKELLELILSKIEKEKTVKEIEFLYSELIKRENLMSTGIGEKVAIPHACVEGFDTFLIGIGILKNYVNWDSFDSKPVKIVIMVIFGKKARNEYLKIIGKISRVLKVRRNRKEILKTENKEKILNIFLNQM